MKKIILGENTHNDTVEDIISIESAEERIETQNYKAEFSKTGEDMVSLKKDTNEIKLKYISSKNINVNPDINETNKIVIYKDVEDGIDLKYELEDNRLKESFIIKERKKDYIFNFEAKIGNLEPFYNEEKKCLEFKDKNTVVYRMLPPFMFDNMGEKSKKCSYEIENSGSHILKIKLIADAEWINADERELPITIDPTFEIEVSGTQTNVIQYGSIESDEKDEVFVGYKNQDGQLKFYSFSINIELDQIPSDITDKDVIFEIPVNYNIMDENDKIVVFVNNSVTGVYKPSQLLNDSVLRINVTESLRNNTYASIIFRSCSDDLLARSGSPYYESKTFKTGVYKASFQVKDSSGSMRARVVVEPKEESKEYVNYDIGESGITSINLQTKRYKHRINDLSIRSGLLTLNLDHIFDSKSNSNGVYGQNWGLSISQTLIKEKYYFGNVITYTDDKGIKHKFIEKWFYKYGSNKYYVNKDSVTISDNNELVLKSDGTKVEYELFNEDGYQLVSLGSSTNYDADLKYDYYIKYKGFRKQVFEGSNYVQFVYNDGTNTVYVDCSQVELRSTGFVANVSGKDRKVYLSSSPININLSSGIAKMITGNVSLVKVPIYDIADNNLYNDGDLENLEYQMNQAKYSLEEIKAVIDSNKKMESNIVGTIKNINFDAVNTINAQDDYDGYLRQNETLASNQEKYANFMTIENTLISSYNQKSSIEKNLYFLRRSFNSKRKEVKASVNDYVIDKDGNILLFDGNGKLIGITDERENRIDIVLNDDLNVERIESAEEQIIFKYNDNKKLELMKKTNGDTVRYTYAGDNLSEIDRNGRKTTFTYMNGFVVYSDINDEIVVDNQTHNTLKVKKYVEPSSINETKEFDMFVDRTLIQNDMFVYSNNFNTTTITDRIKNQTTTLDFDISGNVKKQSNSKYTTYSNYFKGKLISSATIKNDAKIMMSENGSTLSGNKLTFPNNTKQKYSSRTNAYCLKVDLKDLPASCEDFKSLTLSLTYEKSDGTYSFKQTFIGKDNETIVLPFFLRGEAWNMVTTIEALLDSETAIRSYIDKISICDMESGVLNEYDERDRLWKIKTNEGKTTYLTFEDKLPIRIEFKDWDGKATTTDCLYDNEGKLISSVDSKGNCKSYLYEDGGNKLEVKEFNLKDAALIKSKKTRYDEATKSYLEEGLIKNSSGEFPVNKTEFYPGTDIVRSEVDLDGRRTDFNINPRTKKVVGLIKENNGFKNSISYVYNLDFLTLVKCSQAEVNYTYDGSKRVKTVKIKGYSYNTISNVYSDNLTFTGIDNKSYSHDSKIKTTINGIYTITNAYDIDGKLIETIQGDSTNSKIYSTNITYDSLDQIQNVVTNKSCDKSYKETIQYKYFINGCVNECTKTTEENGNVVETIIQNYGRDIDGIVTNYSLKINNVVIQDTAYTYKDKLLIQESLTGKGTIKYEYDALNRVNHKQFDNENISLCHSYSYLQQDGNTLDLVAEDLVKISSGVDSYLIENHKYNYDANGRVIETFIDDKKITYTYDNSGRLVNEHNELLGVENRYTYDNLGNITSKKTFDLETDSLIDSTDLVYSCDSKHLLISINDDHVTHDDYGRIKTYKEKTFAWNNDGTLKSVTKDISSKRSRYIGRTSEIVKAVLKSRFVNNVTLNLDEVIEYEYNDKGIRYSKKLGNGKTIRYILDGSKILAEKHTDEFVINYFYSANELIGFSYNDQNYIYEKNIFGSSCTCYGTLLPYCGRLCHTKAGRFENCRCFRPSL